MKMYYISPKISLYPPHLLNLDIFSQFLLLSSHRPFLLSSLQYGNELIET